jgi:ABC-type dipeptide/oligopeptide/nickel transport system permease subunit
MAQATPDQVKVVDFAVREHRSLWGDAWRRLISNRTAQLGMFIVFFIVISTTMAHFFWEYDPKIDSDYTLKLKPPNLTANEDVESIHIFGTDQLGRDIFRRVVHGGWNSIMVGFVAVGISLSIGGLLGLLAGFFEAVPISSTERYAFKGAVGLFLGLLPAWIADQNIIWVLFALLGLLSAYADLHWSEKSWRAWLIILLGAAFGAVPALMTSIYTALFTGFLGLLIGMILSRRLGGELLSNTTMRGMDIILAFPSYLLAIAIVVFLGPGLEKGMIAIGIVGIPVFARLVRSSVLSVIQKEYVLAANATGEGHSRIMFRHILPNILSPIIVQSTMALAGAILAAAALGYLGLGAQPPEPEWGSMLGDSYRFLTSGAWWAVIFPGVAIMLIVLGFNLLGDGLRDALDPKLKV